MLSNGDVNLLNLHELRQLNHCPPHFEKLTIEIKNNNQIKFISDWLYENLEGRFYVGYGFDNGTSVSEINLIWSNRTITVAFELPSEATYFSLMLNQII